MKIGDKVEKISGYKYPGIVVARFNKLNDSKQIRLVVECTEPTVYGMLHIFREGQLKKVEEEVTFTKKWWWPWGKEKGTCYDL